jgi:hypothetical protein
MLAWQGLTRQTRPLWFQWLAGATEPRRSAWRDTVTPPPPANHGI